MSATAENLAMTDKIPGLETFIDHPSGYFTLSDRNRHFQMNGIPGFIAYREYGRHYVIFGGVNAPEDKQAELLQAFIAEAEVHKRNIVAVQVRESQVHLFRNIGATVNQLGSSFCVDLVGYTFAGTRKMRLRNKIKRAEKAGLKVLEVGKGLPRDESTFARLNQVSDKWLAAKGKKELDFMIGELGCASDTERRIFVVQDKKGEFIAFITYVPVWGGRPGYLHDLTRKLPDAPTGAMELCNARALEQMMEEGIKYLHFGFTPFIVDEVEPEGGQGFIAWLVRLLYRHGSVVYPAKTQSEYKVKWGTDIIEREYIAARPFSLRCAFDLLRLTRSI
ncbi:MAG: DUF2156 domain-containing protein [Gammaproteobacteria bacterium]|nr:DUF2156 domain-containing protein [Gammaproteobacteria bacterium]MDH5651176.1 DUF2156 domain-containing protein [Gammaproteobacteria bacterium]